MTPDMNALDIGGYPESLDAPLSDGEINRILYGRSTPLVRHPVTGHMVSARNSSGDAGCSRAASQWRTGSTTPDTFKVLAACRAKAAAHKMAGNLRAAGKEGHAQVLESRAKSGKIGVGNRKALASKLKAARKSKAKLVSHPEQPEVEASQKTGHENSHGRPSLREQVSAHRLNKGSRSDRLDSLANQASAHHEMIALDQGAGSKAYQSAIKRAIRIKRAADAARPELSPRDAAMVRKANDDRFAEAQAMTPKRAIKLKPTSELHKAAREAVGSALESRSAAEEANRVPGLDPEKKNQYFSIAERRYKEAQGPLKALRREQGKSKAAAPATPPAAPPETPATPPAPPTRPLRTSVQDVTGALRKSGFQSGVSSRRMQRSGYGAVQLKGGAVAVSFYDHGKTGADYHAESEKMESALKTAGFQVERPFPDKHILGVNRRGTQEQIDAIKAKRAEKRAADIAHGQALVANPSTLASPTGKPPESRPSGIKIAGRTIHPKFNEDGSDSITYQGKTKVVTFTKDGIKGGYVETQDHKVHPFSIRGKAPAKAAATPPAAPQAAPQPPSRVRSSEQDTLGHPSRDVADEPTFEGLMAKGHKEIGPNAGKGGKASTPALHLPTFAANAHASASSIPASRRFGGDKAFIHHVHEAYQAKHGAIPRADFNNHLLDANRAGHLELSRADMVEAMKPGDVKASDTHHPMGGTFNFVMVPKPKPANTASPASPIDWKAIVRDAESAQRQRDAEVLKNARASGALPHGKGAVFKAARSLGDRTYAQIINADRVTGLPLNRDWAGNLTPESVKKLKRKQRELLVEKLRDRAQGR